MGIRTKQKDGKFCLISSYNDTRIHKKKWIDREEAVSNLIFRDYIRFMEETVKTYMEFPHHTCPEVGRIYVDEERAGKGLDWLLKAQRQDKYFDRLEKKFKEILKALDLEL